jgi:hypothetical protein
MDGKQKEAKRAYKETARPMGIFQVRNLLNDKIFIGHAVDLPGIFNRYRFQLEMGNHPSKRLQAEWTEFGAFNFVFEILDEISPNKATGYDYRADLNSLEDLWLEKLTPYGDHGYNEPKKGREERLHMIMRNRVAAR